MKHQESKAWLPAGPAQQDIALLCECQEVTHNTMNKVFAFLLCSKDCFALRRRETDCYTWHDTNVRHTYENAACAGETISPGISVSSNEASQLAKLIVLCDVESFPEADGLLCGQRSNCIVSPNYIRALFFQDGIHARR